MLDIPESVLRKLSVDQNPAFELAHLLLSGQCGDDAHPNKVSNVAKNAAFLQSVIFAKFAES
ncbi:hypothetical protein NIES4075_73220 [Tolypothrix sp. NIES-4075]|nr:hypothetical protein NIES4075_73220 [Tolypothrix sp. NIES-4075]